MKKFIENWFYSRSVFQYYSLKIYTEGITVIDIYGPPGIGKSTYINMLIKAGVLEKRSVKIDFKKSISTPHALLLKYSCDGINDLGVLKRKANKLHFDLNAQQGKSALIIDEGISHQFTQPLIDVCHNHPEEFAELCKSRAAINLVAPPAVISSRIKARMESSSKMLGYHKGKNDDELEKFNLSLLEKRKELSDIYSKFAMPVLELDVTGEPGKAVESTVAFLKSLSKS